LAGTFEKKPLTTRQKIWIALAVAFVTIIVPLGVLVSLAIYSYRAAERAGNEAATIQNMKTIAVVEMQYFNTHDRTYATINQLEREQRLSAKFAAQPTVVDGYVLTLKLEHPDSYRLTADPQDRSSGTRHFYLDSASMQIHQNPGGPAGPKDPVMHSK
jgi:hypothetical protein